MPDFKFYITITVKDKKTRAEAKKRILEVCDYCGVIVEEPKLTAPPKPILSRKEQQAAFDAGKAWGRARCAGKKKEARNAK